MAGEFEAVEFHGMMNLYYPFRNSMPKLLNDVSWVRREEVSTRLSDSNKMRALRLMKPIVSMLLHDIEKGEIDTSV